ncbi:alpha/beta hydrolase [Herbaspirillum hiltneri N3]|uniref:Alpha/beta hydrolase n=1 Tax=Herbaspirillum hiltneri N3 TaxID=1262470 RepID=A0ABN4HZJ4_9BURK|nr:alpha/beta hydrolase [Herbaspirillum hiltneri]AKZ63617.1 alpha/beta hydrolase [Herbaspirillum hiltneri N3]
MNERRVELEVDGETIAGDILSATAAVNAPGVLFLHGAGQSHRQRQRILREELATLGLGSIAFDFSGHGESSANAPGSLQKRLRQAEQVLQHFDPGHHIHTVAGVSMSGEIAIRLACKDASGIGHVVLMVGAIYDRMAFALPFGPAFSAALRRPGSWRDAETLELIRSYRGGLTIIRALDDAVIPHEVADLLMDAAQSTRFRRLIDLPGVDHRLSEKIAQDAALRRRIATAISADELHKQDTREEK